MSDGGARGTGRAVAGSRRIIGPGVAPPRLGPSGVARAVVVIGAVVLASSFWFAIVAGVAVLLPASVAVVAAYVLVALAPIARLVRAFRVDVALRRWVALAAVLGAGLVPVSFVTVWPLAAVLRAPVFDGLDELVPVDPVAESSESVDLMVALAVADVLWTTAGVVLLLLIGRRTLVRPIDGLLVGAGVGAGYQFAMGLLATFEPIMAASAGAFEYLWPNALAHLLGVFASTWVSAAVVGLGVATARWRWTVGGRPVRLLAPVAALAVASVLHVSWLVRHWWFTDEADGLADGLRVLLPVCVWGVLVIVSAVGWARWQDDRAAPPRDAERAPPDWIPPDAGAVARR